MTDSLLARSASLPGSSTLLADQHYNTKSSSLKWRHYNPTQQSHSICLHLLSIYGPEPSLMRDMVSGRDHPTTQTVSVRAWHLLP